MLDNKIEFVLLEEISENHCKLKGIITGDKFEIDEDKRKLYISVDDYIVAIINFKDWANGTDTEEEEKYHIYI